MRTIVLISCGSAKKSVRSMARDLYIGNPFVQQLLHAESLSPDATFILSAKYGLLGLEEEVEPYDLALTSLSKNERKAWAAKVMERLAAQADPSVDRFIILASKAYAEYLLPHLEHAELPLKGLRQGERLHYFKEHGGASHA
jgi:hypothetical protein